MNKFSNVSNAGCKLCQGIERSKGGLLSTFIYEFKNSILVLGDHQYFEGYCILVSKIHARELHLLPQNVQSEFFSELMFATQVIFKTFKPWKMNHASYGNLEPHVHWHVIPREESDPDRHHHPWYNSDSFEDYLLAPGEGSETIRKIRSTLKSEAKNASIGAPL